MKTIEQYNKEMEGLTPTWITFHISVRWKHSGLVCNCGCDGGEMLFEDPNMETWKAERQKVKCSKTGKIGKIYYDGSIYKIIKKVEWEK